MNDFYVEAIGVGSAAFWGKPLVALWLLHALAEKLRCAIFGSAMSKAIGLGTATRHTNWLGNSCRCCCSGSYIGVSRQLEKPNRLIAAIVIPKYINTD